MALSSRISRRRHAFTLVELLVVIAIIGTLVALLLPAVQAARGSTRTAQCASQIGELAKGMIAYQTSKDNFPGFAQFVKRGQTEWATAKYPAPSGAARVYVDSVSNRNQAVPFSWATMLLRNIERQDIWDQIVDRNMKPEIRLIEVYRCPSDLDAAEVGDRAALSYNANTGAWDRDSSGDFLVGSGVGDTGDNGVFFDLASSELAGKKGVTMRLSNITDGAATTIMLSENINKTYDPTTSGAEPSFSWLYGNEQQVGMVWVVNLTPSTGTALTKQEGINRNSADQITFDPKTPLYARPASSHGTGVNVAFCDAHIKFIGDDIDYIVYQQLMTPRGSKCVDPVAWTPVATNGPIDTFRRASPLSEQDFN